MELRLQISLDLGGIYGTYIIWVDRSRLGDLAVQIDGEHGRFPEHLKT